MAEPNGKDLFNQAEAEVLTRLQADGELAAAVKLFDRQLKDTRSFYENQIPAVSIGALSSVDLHTLDETGLFTVRVLMVARVYSRGADRAVVTDAVQALTAKVVHVIRNEVYNPAPFQGFAETSRVVSAAFQDGVQRSGDDSPTYDVEGYIEFQLDVELLRP